MLQSILILFIIIILIYCSIHLFFYFFSKFFSVLYVRGNSMEPSLKQGDRILILKYAYQAYLKKGQIVVLSLPDPQHSFPRNYQTESKRLLVKRVVGLAGDRDVIQFHLADPVPDRHVFVLGDNPESRDSRHWGSIPLDSIHGIVIARLGRGDKTIPSSLFKIW
jgi:signal peptidase I